MKPLNDVNKGNDVKNQPVEEMKAEPEKIDFSKVKIEPLFEEMVDFDTFSKSDFRAVKVWWKGACGHEWETSVKARSNGEKCPICSGARVVTGINDLSTLKPELPKN